jgi:hypothetical protein
MQTMIKNALVSVLGVVLALGLIAAGGEIVLRCTTLGQSGREWFLGGNHPRNMVVADPDLGYRLQPGFRGRELNVLGDFDVPVVTNSLGLRDAERDYRGCGWSILGLGDSYTFGEGVSAEDTFLSQLERRLNQGRRDLRCVVNAGVPGYGIHQISALYQRLGGQIPHRVALLAVCQDNLERVKRGFAEFHGWVVFEELLPVLQSCPNGDIFREKESLNGLYRQLYCHSEVFPWLMGRRTMNGVRLGDAWPDKTLGPEPPSSRDAAATYLLAMKEMSVRIGAEMVVMEFDDHAEQIERFCRANGIRYFAVPNPPLWSYEHDRHWNPAGHSAVAGLVFDYLKGEGLLPP